MHSHCKEKANQCVLTELHPPRKKRGRLVNILITVSQMFVTGKKKRGSQSHNNVPT